MDNFYNQLHGNGQKGEDLFLRYANNSDKVKEVFEINDLSEQKKGKDFLVELSNGNTVTVEVKYDVRSSATGNFYIETEQHGKKGWLYTCQSNYMFLINGSSGNALFVEPEILREYIRSHNESLRTVQCDNDYSGASTGVLLPTTMCPGKWVTI